MAEKRKTQKEYFGEIRKILSEMGKDELVNFVDSRIELINKKANSGEETKVQKTNKELKQIIIDVLINLGEKARIADIQASDERLMTYEGKKITNQKITALLTQLKEEQKVVQIKDKKISYYKIVD